MNKYKQAAQGILANPEFDVEGFVKAINVHYQNRYVVEALGSNPDIFLGLIESGDYKFLEIIPAFISKEVFPQLAEKGYEVWTRVKKETHRLDSNWFGAVLNEELAISYRSLGHVRKYVATFKVIKGENAAQNARKQWKGVKMRLLGEEPKVITTPPVYEVRDQVRDFFNSSLHLTRRRLYGAPSSIFKWFHYSNSRSKLAFQILQSGKDHVRVRIECYEDEARVKDGLKKTQGGVSLGIRLPINDPNLALKAIDWASQATTGNFNFRDAHIDLDYNIKALKKRAGI